VTPKQRVLYALKGGRPDRVPIFDYINSRPLFKEVLGYAVETRTAEDILRCSVKIGYDLAVVNYGRKGSFKLGGSRYRDEWGTVYEKSDVNWPADAPIGASVESREDLRNFDWPDPDDLDRLDGIRTAVSIGNEHQIAVAGSIRGPFSSAWLVLGFETLMVSLYDDPAFVAEIMDRCVGFYVRGAQRMVEAGIDALVFTDDYGNKQSPFISPDQFRLHVLPHTAGMISRIKSLGVPIIMHSDGNIAPLLADLVRAGIHAYHPVERSAGMSLAAVRSLFGPSLALLGNVDNKTTLVTGSVEDVEEEVRECIRVAAPTGGYILASDHSLHGDIPNRNVFALYEAGRRYGA